MEVNQLAGQLFTLWNNFIKIAMVKPKILINLLQEDFHQKIWNRWSESICWEII